MGKLLYMVGTYVYVFMNLQYLDMNVNNIQPDIWYYFANSLIM